MCFFRSGIDRLVEDLIQESMHRGEFDNLPGKGKPLTSSNHNPMLDLTTQNINRILVDSGFAPEWVTLQSEIRSEKLNCFNFVGDRHNGAISYVRFRPGFTKPGLNSC